MHNKLRRDLQAAINDFTHKPGDPGIAPTALHALGREMLRTLLAKALTALGGPVADMRPQDVTAAPEGDSALANDEGAVDTDPVPVEGVSTIHTRADATRESYPDEEAFRNV